MGRWAALILRMRAADLAAVVPLMRNKSHPLRRHLRTLMVTVVCGVLATLLGVSVMAGWHLHLEELIRVRPGFAPMVYNTALNMVITGLGLVFLARGWQRAGLACGGLVLFFGLGTMLEYLLGTNFRIDELVLRDYLLTTNPGRMSPVTSIGFSLLGSCLLVSHGSRTRQWRTVALALMSSGVTAICLMALFGYSTGLNGTFAWGHLTPMALHTAVGQGLLGVGFFSLAWRQGYQQAGGTPRWLPLPVALGAALAALILSHAMQVRQDVEVSRTIKASAADATNQIGAQTDSLLLALRRMAQRRAASDQPEAVWRADAQTYVHDFVGFKAIEWADPSFVIRWVEPMAGNESALNLNLTGEPRRRRAVEAARASRQPVLTRPVRLVQGGRGLLAYVPVYQGDDFGGLIIGVLRLRTYFDSMLPSTVAPGYGIQIWDDEESIYTRDAERPSQLEKWRVTETIHLHGVSWRVSIWPSPALLDQQSSPLPMAILLGGAVMALLLGYMVFLAQKARAQTRDVQLAASKLRQSEERFRIAFDDAPIGIALVSVEGRWLQVNHALATMLGYTKEELRETSVQTVTRPEDQDSDLALVAKMLAGEMNSYQTEKRYLHKNGSVVNVMLSVSLAREQNGEPLYLVTQIEDITARVLAEATLRESEARFRLLVDGVTDYALLMLDPAGHIVSWNGGAERMKGYKADEVLGQHFSLFYPDDDGAQGSHAFLAAAARDGRAEQAGWRVRKDGSRFWAETILSAIRDESGELRGFAKITRDLTERRNAAQALQETLTLQNAVLNNAAYSIIATDPEGIITIFNATAEAMLGYGAEEMIGQNSPAVLHRPQEVEARALELSQELGEPIAPGFDVFVAKSRRGLPDSHQWTYIRKDGTTFPILLSVTTLFDESGQVTGFLGIANDITERKKWEEALEEANQRLQLASQISGIGVWDWNISTGEVIYDERMFALYGLEKKAVNYQNWAEQVVPEDLEQQAGILQKTMREGGRSERQFRIRRANDGALRVIDAAEMAVVDESGETVRMVGVNRDVTDLENAMANLSASEELLREFIKHTPAAIAMLDTEMRYVQASNRWLTDYHLDGRDIIGVSHYEIFPDIPQHWIDLHRRVLAGAVESREEDEFPRASGGTEWLQWEARPWVKAGGEIGGIIFFTQVITERKREEEEKRQMSAVLEETNRDLKRQNREIQNFYHTLSHELKTPLTSTREFVSIVLDGIAGEVNAEQREYLEIAQSGCKQLQVCINDLLDVTRLETGKLHVELKSTELEPFIRQVVGALQPLAAERDLCLVLELTPDLGSIPLDSARLTQVLNNLVGNAFKFTPPGGRITVTASRPPTAPGFIAVSVADTGRGVPAEKLDRIFERLYQVKDSDASTEQGMGLGLYICRELVELHGGRFEVTSDLNRGSEFTFFLPRAEAPVVRHTILVVDDESEIRDVLRDAFEPAGFTVTSAGDGREALALASEQMPDLVVMDLKMPNLDGPTMLRELRRQSPALPVIIHTGYPEGALMTRAWELSPFTVLTKPCSMQQMVTEARAQLHRGLINN